jgi:alanine racemase
MSIQVNIDLGAFERNVASLVNRVAPASVWIALKSHAYGHGMIELADNALRAGASGLAVLDVPAAIALRNHGVSSTLFAWLHGNETDFDAAVSHTVDIGISTIEQLNAAAQAGATIGVPARVHLKIDSGLHRNGFTETDWVSACDAAVRHEATGAITVVGIWSHLADAGLDADKAALARFDSALAHAHAAGLNPTVRHIAASSAGFTNVDARYDVVRFGILAYGVSPFESETGSQLGLSPIMSVTSTVAALDDGRVIVEAGWFDGIPQNPRAAWVLVGDERCAVTQVHPRFTVIDRPASFSAGATVAVIGNGGPSAEDWATWTNTIGDEIVTGIPSTARRVFSS